MAVLRCPDNPIITPADVKPSGKDFEVIGVFNAGVTRFNDEVILLTRVAERPISKHPELELTAIYNSDENKTVIKEFSKDDPEIDFSDPRMTITPAGKFLTSLSHFRIARSKDGCNFTFDPAPAMFPQTPYESFGIEDPRISKIDDTSYIDYVAVSPAGITTALAETKDFKTFKRLGLIFCPDNKDVIIFPEKINGKFYAIHRPVTPLFEKYEMWIAESPDLLKWGNHRHFLAVQPDSWDNAKIGGGAVPFRTKQGWIEIYHAADEKNRYCLGAVLTHPQRPWQIIARSAEPILQPETDYEIQGFFGNVVFTCGLLFEENTLKIYYGVSDTSIAQAQLPLNDVMKTLKYIT
jgi:predicted GH43/DUF377 family glycosyl hydrolase